MAAPVPTVGNVVVINTNHTAVSNDIPLKGVIAQQEAVAAPVQVLFENGTVYQGSEDNVPVSTTLLQLVASPPDAAALQAKYQGTVVQVGTTVPELVGLVSDIYLRVPFTPTKVSLVAVIALVGPSGPPRFVVITAPTDVDAGDPLPPALPIVDQFLSIVANQSPRYK